MRRRNFMAVLAGATTVATRRDAGAQQTPRVWRIGILDTAPRQLNGPNLEAFYKRLQELGYVEGENLKVEKCQWRELQRPLPRRVPEPRMVPLAGRGEGGDRELATSL